MTNDETALELIQAVEATFGPLGIDLACTTANKKAPYGICYPHADALTVPWFELAAGDIGWLNPPPGDQFDWTRKCASEAKLGARILYITEAALDTAAFWVHVWPNADVYMLHPRTAYDGRPAPVMVCAFNVQPLHLPRNAPTGENLVLWLWSNEPPLVVRSVKSDGQRVVGGGIV